MVTFQTWFHPGLLKIIAAAFGLAVLVKLPMPVVLMVHAEKWSTVHQIVLAALGVLRLHRVQAAPQ
jgi:hypothetical protein